MRCAHCGKDRGAYCSDCYQRGRGAGCMIGVTATTIVFVLILTFLQGCVQ